METFPKDLFKMVEAWIVDHDQGKAVGGMRGQRVGLGIDGIEQLFSEKWSWITTGDEGFVEIGGVGIKFDRVTTYCHSGVVHF